MKNQRIKKSQSRKVLDLTRMQEYARRGDVQSLRDMGVSPQGIEYLLGHSTPSAKLSKILVGSPHQSKPEKTVLTVAGLPSMSQLRSSLSIVVDDVPGLADVFLLRAWKFVWQVKSMRENLIMPRGYLPLIDGVEWLRFSGTGLFESINTEIERRGLNRIYRLQFANLNESTNEVFHV